MISPIQKELTFRNIFAAASDGLIISDLATQLVVEANQAALSMHGYVREAFVGLQLASLIHPDDRQSLVEQLGKLQSEGVLEARFLHVRKDGSTFIAEWRGAVFDFQGQPSLLTVVRDVNNRVQAEEQLHQQLDAHAREQATLLEISHTLASTLELQPGLILDELRGIIAYSRGGLFRLEDTTLVALAMRGVPQGEDSPFHINLHSRESLASIFTSHQPIRINDVWSEEKQAQFLRLLLGEEGPALLEGMRSWMWVPMAAKGRIIGGVGVAHPARDHFTLHHADLALSVANQAAITMVNAELRGHAQALAVLQERQSLARNLHDAVNQSLFSAGLIAEVLPRLWDQDQQEARQSLEDLRRLTRGAMAEMRALLGELRPSSLTDADLGDLLHQLGDGFTGRTNIPVKLTVSGHGVLPETVQVAFYRLCQEALTNIAKHAKATQVEMLLKHNPNGLEFSLRDDGDGFNPERPSPGHYGLAMMRERARAVNAHLSIASQPGHGTEVKISWEEPQVREI